jgi:prephenate dehydratase
MTALAKESDFEIAYLGPEGSFAHLVAQKRYPNHSLIPFRTVPEVFNFLERHETGKGIVPIENSSGGLIPQTVDGIIEHACSLFIQEELSIDVKLALMAQRGAVITKIFSHFAPLHHCESFLKERFPNAKTIPCDSTSAAAQAAANDQNSAAIGPIANAETCGLDVIEYPIQDDVPNVTQFFVVGHTRQNALASEKTSLVVAMSNEPGSLCAFLKPFADAGVNLTRIESRPIIGRPNTYMFLVELKGTENDEPVRSAFQGSKAASTKFFNVGSYPVISRYKTE